MEKDADQTLIVRPGPSEPILGTALIAFAAFGWCNFTDPELVTSSILFGILGPFVIVPWFLRWPRVVFHQDGISFFKFGRPYAHLAWTRVESISICRFRGRRYGRPWVLDIAGPWQNTDRRPLRGDWLSGDKFLAYYLRAFTASEAADFVEGEKQLMFVDVRMLGVSEATLLRVLRFHLEHAAPGRWPTEEHSDRTGEIRFLWKR